MWVPSAANANQTCRQIELSCFKFLPLSRDRRTEAPLNIHWLEYVIVDGMIVEDQDPF